MDDKVYEIEIFLVCDMVCLIELLGLYSTWHSRAKFRCCWCNVTKEKMGDFSPEQQWLFRDIEEMKRIGKKRRTEAKTTARANASTDGGILVSVAHD